MNQNVKRIALIATSLTFVLLLSLSFTAMAQSEREAEEQASASDPLQIEDLRQVSDRDAEYSDFEDLETEWEQDEDGGLEDQDDEYEDDFDEWEDEEHEEDYFEECDDERSEEGQLEAAINLGQLVSSKPASIAYALQLLIERSDVDDLIPHLEMIQQSTNDEQVRRIAQLQLLVAYDEADQQDKMMTVLTELAR